MQNVDALHLSIALGPLAVYLLLLGFVNLSTRPFVTTGARDVGALGLAIAGLIVAGPMELFLPVGGHESLRRLRLDAVGRLLWTVSDVACPAACGPGW